jgi:chromate transporter
MGAAAICVNLGTGVRSARRNIDGIISVVVVGIVALSIGLFGFSPVRVLLAMMPVSLVAAWLTRPR